MLRIRVLVYNCTLHYASHCYCPRPILVLFSMTFRLFHSLAFLGWLSFLFLTKFVFGCCVSMDELWPNYKWAGTCPTDHIKTGNLQLYCNVIVVVDSFVLQMIVFFVVHCKKCLLENNGLI